MSTTATTSSSGETPTTLRLDAADAAAIAAAAGCLRRGLPVVFPTDTVYGVGVLPFDAMAIERLYAAKGRPAEKGIPVLLADAADVAQVAGDIPPAAAALLARFWPGALTLIVPRRAELPANLSPDDTVAVRVPDHPVARALIRAAGGAVAATSANVSGRPAARSADEAMAGLAGRVAAILDDGPSPGGRASTIVDCTVNPPLILRPGPLTAAVLGLEGA